jgi:hypothetical protein
MKKKQKLTISRKFYQKYLDISSIQQDMVLLNDATVRAVY